SAHGNATARRLIETGTREVTREVLVLGIVSPKRSDSERSCGKPKKSDASASRTTRPNCVPRVDRLHLNTITNESRHGQILGRAARFFTCQRVKVTRFPWSRTVPL